MFNVRTQKVEDHPTYWARKLTITCWEHQYKINAIRQRLDALEVAPPRRRQGMWK